jgi:hypothetical protein
MQVWATWLLCAVLVDLTDAVAEAINQPFAALHGDGLSQSVLFHSGVPAGPSHGCGRLLGHQCQATWDCEASQKTRSKKSTGGTVALDKSLQPLTCNQCPQAIKHNSNCCLNVSKGQSKIGQRRNRNKSSPASRLPGVVVHAAINPAARTISVVSSVKSCEVP